MAKATPLSGLAAEHNRRVAAAFARARQGLGILKHAEMARQLRRHLSSDQPSDTTYGRWEKDEQTIPAYALIAVAELSALSVADLVEENKPSHERRISRLEQENRSYEQRLEELEEQFRRRPPSSPSDEATAS